MLGGMLPVPLPVCTDDEKRRKLTNVVSTLERPAVVIEDVLIKTISSALQGVRVLPVSAVAEAGLPGRPCEADQDAIAMIQFSSGSTGMPKGVQLTHRNIIANVHSIVDAAGFDHEDSVLSWLPLTHDMGLIGAHLTAVLLGVEQYIMSTELFLRRPALWFDKISEYGVTVTLAPNFAYKYVLSLLRSGTEFSWNLHRLRLILNGAEPISAEVCERFGQAMRPYGLREDTILNVYGMAEASLAVAFSAPHEKLAYTYFDRGSLSIGSKVRQTTEHGAESVAIVHVGTAVPDCQIRIADEQDNVLEPDTVGEIQLAGPHITCGYYMADAQNAALFTPDGWLHTGDIGFFFDGRLFISGRCKEILFVNGQNFYPYDIEETIERMMALPAGSTAVCGVSDSHAGRDRIYVFTESLGERTAEQFTSDLREQMLRGMKLYPDQIIKVDHLPRTESGKLRRICLKEEAMKALAAQAAPHTASQSESAVSETEALLLELCRSCLAEDSTAPIGVSDSFMEMGFDSVHLVSLSEKISERFGRKVDVTQVFAYPTIRAMATYLEGRETVQMPEIRFSQPDGAGCKNSGGCVCFTLPAAQVAQGMELPGRLSDSIRNVCGTDCYSFHCMCDSPDVIDHYEHGAEGLALCGRLYTEDLMTARCCGKGALSCILFDSEYNCCNRNLIHDYDIAIEYQIREDQVRFDCYHSSGTEETLLVTLADELAASLVRKEIVYA
jgi:acyl-CoA synthetase (AMP-forming)/AMP-acid ligase II/acyl carrier protein